MKIWPSALFLMLACVANGRAQKTYQLKASPTTIAWCYYDASLKPVLRIQSGDRVEIQTVSGNPARLESSGLPPAQIQPELRAIYDGGSRDDRLSRQRKTSQPR